MGILGVVVIISGIVLIVVGEDTEPHDKIGTALIVAGASFGGFGISMNGRKKKEHQLNENCADTTIIKNEINSLKEDIKFIKEWIKRKEEK